MANVLSIVSYKIFPANSGGQKCIVSFNEYFARHHNLYCITVKSNSPSAAKYKILNTLSNSFFRYINVFYFFTIKKIIKENKISHVIIEHPYYGWLGLLLQRFCKVKFIIHSHNIEAERFKVTGKWWWKILWHYEKFVHIKADFTFCITEKDLQYFIDYYKIDAEKTAVITYGISWNLVPEIAERNSAKSELLKKYSLNIETVLFVFNGALDYKPNFEAVKNIVDNINPLFKKNKIIYKVLICGRNLPAFFNGLKQYAEDNIIYAGFVEDINLYLKGADVFINPVVDGGGIKTKLVEAIGNDLNAVSTVNGAVGIDADICNGKLLITDNNNWQHFSEKMKEALAIKSSANSRFFNYFYWDNIAKKAAAIVDQL